MIILSITTSLTLKSLHTIEETGSLIIAALLPFAMS